MTERMTERIGVAISTTGDPHRIDLLRQCVAAWCALPGPLSLFVTVDGTLRDAKRVAEAVYEHTGSVYRVGRPAFPGDMDNNHRVGVAANKNTGLELLMGNTDVDHLFLCDDDTWPLNKRALLLHTQGHSMHSMVCWGRHRLGATHQPHNLAYWTWPRGVLLYMARQVVDRIGGMDERFGAGGHEHVEYSQRIFNAGMSPAPFVTTDIYAQDNAMRAREFWHAEDMPRPGETLGGHRHRKRTLTTIERTAEDWDRINRVLADSQGKAEYVAYRAATNGRSSATLCLIDPSLGAEK